LDNNAQYHTIDYGGQQSDVVSPSMKIVGLERPFKRYAHFEWKKAKKKVTPENKSGGAVSQGGFQIHEDCKVGLYNRFWVKRSCWATL